MKFEGKVALVTGSGRGIGRGIAERFAREGCDIVVNYLENEDEAIVTANAIEASGRKSLCIRADVSNRLQVRNMLTQAIKKFGQIDILVNNAGVLLQKPFETITDEEIDVMFDVCLKGPFLCCQEIYKHFQERQSGRIINIGSMGGQFGGPKAPHYSAAKAGLLCFTKSCARLMAPFGVTVNCISPGFIETDMSRKEIEAIGGHDAAAKSIPAGRVGQPEDIASAAVYLASEESSFVTGHILNVNGGQDML